MRRDLIPIDQLFGPLYDELDSYMKGGEIVVDRESGETISAADAVYANLDLVVAGIIDRLPQMRADHVPDLVLLDKRSSTEVSHRDVGIGVSQVLPVLVDAFAAKKRILAMEQPEIHLHPALQAELGDVFIQSSLGGQGNTFILETHSEHLILRIMRRMRQTADEELPEDIPPVRPDDVAILYVEPKSDAEPWSVVRVLELSETGRLLDPWPGGFFEESFHERFD
jgi:hypothetical protein